MPEKEMQEKNYNVFAIIGFILAFLSPLLGLIFSIIALNQIKHSKEKGHGLALAGLIISITFFALVIIGAIAAFIAYGVLSPRTVAHVISTNYPF